VIGLQTLNDPYYVFNRDRDRDCNYKIADRLENVHRSSIMRSKSLTDFRTRIGARFFSPSEPVALKRIFYRSSIGKPTSRIDLKITFADRFPDRNRIAVFPERFLIASAGANEIKKPGSVCR
jgi:hypothetical protein